MDIFSHGLWTMIYAKIANRKLKKPLNIWHAGFWGVFPDLFAFIPHFFFGHLLHAEWGIPTRILYSLSHSAIIFGIVCIIFIEIKTKGAFSRQSVTNAIPWIFGGWLFHIVAD